MIKTIKPNSNLAEYSNYKLCFIETIPEFIYTYTKEATKIMSAPGYVPGSTYLDIAAVDNPEYKFGEAEMYAYFTPIDLSDQSGSDWDDAPYVDCAEPPSDVINDKEIELVRMPCSIHSYSYYLPATWSEHCPFSINDINSGAVAWIYECSEPRSKSVAMYAGINPETFVAGLAKIDENNPGWEQCKTEFTY